jgi:hypothetical protein
VVIVYVCLHIYNMASKKWLLFKSTASFCYLALTVMRQARILFRPQPARREPKMHCLTLCVVAQVWWCATLAMDADAVVKVLPQQPCFPFCPRPFITSELFLPPPLKQSLAAVFLWISASFHSFLAQGQKACSDAGTLDTSASSFSCLNPFYSEPLCDSACIVNSLLTMAAAWLAKEDTDASGSSARSSSGSNVRCRWLRRTSRFVLMCTHPQQIAYQNYNSQASV